MVSALETGPVNVRQITGHGGNPPGQGPFITVHLALADEEIREASFETYPCPGCQACGKAVCELVRGRSLADARAVNRDAVAGRVGPLERHRQICYGLAVLALSDALRQAEQEPKP